MSLRSGEFSDRMEQAFSPFQRDPASRALMVEVALRKSRDASAFLNCTPGLQKDQLRALSRIFDQILIALPSELRSKVGGNLMLRQFDSDEDAEVWMRSRVVKQEEVLTQWLRENDPLFKEEKAVATTKKEVTFERQVGETKWYQRPELYMPVVGAILCALALLPGLPYAFFSFLRWWVFTACLVIALFSSVSESKFSAIAGLALAVLFNPLVKIHLERDVWWFIDAGMIPYLMITGFKLSALRNNQRHG